MKFNKGVKKEFSNNHRANYQNYNKSNIFDPPPENKNQIRNLKSEKKKTDFQPKFDYQTAFNRRIKEFWNKDEIVKNFANKTTNSLGCLTKEFNSERRDRSCFTPREKKLHDMNPDLKIEDVRSMSKVKSFYEPNSFSATKDTLQSARSRRCNDMNSNIFNDEDKTEDKILKRNKSVFIKRDILQKMAEEEEKKKNEKFEFGSYQSSTKNKQLTQSKSRTNFATNANWKSINSELMSKKGKDTNETYSAADMKRKHLASFFDSEETKQTKKLDFNSKKEETKVEDTFSERFGSGHKSQKLKNLASSLQSKTFTSENYSKVDKQDREIANYEIVSKSGFDKLEPQEIKYLFTRKGIHIYDFQEKGKYHDGFKTGNISFKIRKSDDPEFANKITEINKKITNLGMKLNQTPTNTNKPISELVPTGVKWGDTHLKKFTNKRLESNTLETPKKKIPPSDKLSNVVIQSCSSYKNPFSHKTPLSKSKSYKKI